MILSMVSIIILMGITIFLSLVLPLRDGFILIFLISLTICALLLKILLSFLSLKKRLILYPFLTQNAATLMFFEPLFKLFKWIDFTSVYSKDLITAVSCYIRSIPLNNEKESFFQYYNYIISRLYIWNDDDINISFYRKFFTNHFYTKNNIESSVRYISYILAIDFLTERYKNLPIDDSSTWKQDFITVVKASPFCWPCSDFLKYADSFTTVSEKETIFKDLISLFNHRF